ncbi:MAG TPA: pyruvate dehydrogenase (acetyl-transferring), homodimeric type [Gammaproteobacteria bacterium]|nr:pyruvate dehydrogenase (acetyl-transferring), homodimeric type [Gammaproteobacteria bacterium]
MDDVDPIETKEWLESLQAVKYHAGIDRANFILQTLTNNAKISFTEGVTINTPYINTIQVAQEAPFPGDLALERKIHALTRWNAVAIVVRASKNELDLGGHIGTFASAATLYDIGYNHFWRGGYDGDMVYFQGHSSPGMYARSFLEGRISEDQLKNFRQEVHGKGLSSYPHPWLMPTYWQFPTVSMGLGPIQAIFQAKIQHYLQARGLIPETDRKIWCFCGDGEMDEPESLGCIGLASRERLDNLIFVINCNLQRLDGPVRGNYKIIQELEAIFTGAGWNVIKVIWSSAWDELLQKDTQGILQKRMMEVVDGEYQSYVIHDGAYIREHFFGKSPELLKMVEHLSDEDLQRLQRGGHDPRKVYAAYHAAVNTTGKPTVILTKTVKGFGLGAAGEGLNTAHNTKKMTHEQLVYFRDRFELPVTDEQINDVVFYKPAENSEEIQYLQARRAALGEYLPMRRTHATEKLATPPLEDFAQFFTGTGDREISTTMAFVRIITQLCKDKTIGKYVVPIVPDEARTFGMEGLFRQLGIYSPEGQLYTPVDAEQVMFYKEAKDGQMLQEGLNEAGAFCAWLALATSYSTHNRIMIPFYIYYSMFGFQRIGDLAWAAGDSRARGFLIGATSGRTTLNGEGLQHEDGHSHVMAGLIPNCISYDPTFNFELAVIIQDGLKRMVENQEDVYYYITVMNENYTHPAMPEGSSEGILKGLYKLQDASTPQKTQVQLMGSGTILREVIAAAELLQKYGVAADVWSATSFNELARDGIEVDRWNMMHPEDKPKKAYITQCLEKTKGPVIVATDYVKSYAEQVRKFVPGAYKVLGTDGFGRSDSRANLRHFFEVDRFYITIAALHALAESGEIKASVVSDAIKHFNLDPEKVNPGTH